MNYYQEQLDKLEDSEFFKKIQISDDQGNETKHIDLNVESIPILIDFLQKELEKVS